jgi:phage gpG-like protein
VISLTTIGDAEIIRKFDQFPARLHEEVKKGIGRLALMLARNVQRDKLSGQVLKVRTGRLRRSIASLVEDSGSVVSGVVSTPVKYAPPHEFGFHGTVSVREHVREIKQAWGRSITPKSITVRAHEMKLNLPERSFLRSALHDLEASGAVRAEIEADIARASA